MNRRDFLRAGAALGAASVGGFARAQPVLQSTAADALQLNWNENSLGLAPAARQAVIDVLGRANRYPDAVRDELLEALAARHAVGTENLVLGNGSTEILQMIVQASASPNATLVLADPTFEAISRYQRPLSYQTERVPLDAGFSHDVQRMSEVTASRRRPTVVYLCNPNNPTATLTASADIDAWIAEAPETVLFVVDEAYYEFVKAPGYWSAAKWISRRPNVVVTRTFSKIYAMAGLRLGYALTHPDTAQRLREFMSSDNANLAALVAAAASLEDSELIPRSRRANETARRIVLACLDELGLEHLPSHANFLMHRVPGDLGTYIERMREHGIRVGRVFPAMPSHNRLSLGLPEEMERFAETLRRFRRNGWV